VKEWRGDALRAAGGNRDELRACRALSNNYTGGRGEGCQVPLVRDHMAWRIDCRKSTRY